MNLSDLFKEGRVLQVGSFAELGEHLGTLFQQMQGLQEDRHAEIIGAEVLYKAKPFLLPVAEADEEEDDDIDAWLEEMDQHGPDPFDELDFAAAMNWPDEDDEPDAGPEEDEPEEYETWIASIRLTQQNHRHPAQLLMVVESETRMLVMEIQDGFFLAGWRGCQLLVNLDPEQPLTQELVVAAIKLCTRDGDLVQEAIRWLNDLGGLDALDGIMSEIIPEEIIAICQRLISLDLMPAWHLTAEILKGTVTWTEELGALGVLTDQQLTNLTDLRNTQMHPYRHAIYLYANELARYTIGQNAPDLVVRRVREQIQTNLERHLVSALEIVPLAEQQTVNMLALTLTMALLSQREGKDLADLYGAIIEASDFALNYFDSLMQSPVSDRECRTFVRGWVYKLPSAQVVNPLTHGPF